MAFSSDAIATLLDGLLDREAEIGATFTWAGATYACSGGEQLFSLLLQEGGFRQPEEVTIAVRIAVFPNGSALPKQKQSLSYTSSPGATPNALRINKITYLWGQVLVMECHAGSQGS